MDFLDIVGSKNPGTQWMSRNEASLFAICLFPSPIFQR